MDETTPPPLLETEQPKGLKEDSPIDSSVEEAGTPTMVFVNANALQLPETSAIHATDEQIAAVAGETSTRSVSATRTTAEPCAIWKPNEFDVLSGRGALVNAHPGNKKFRAVCFSRKSAFDRANHAAKKCIATEIWGTMVSTYGSRFLRKHHKNGPWVELDQKAAILKAAQVIRDYKRPDRVVQREVLNAKGKRRPNRATSTPMDDVPPPATAPIRDNPDGVQANDVLCGRGAVRGPAILSFSLTGFTNIRLWFLLMSAATFCFSIQYVNGHGGNQQLRKLAQDRKPQFDSGAYVVKRLLAMEIVSIISNLNPPGRFLKKNNDNIWEDIGQDEAIQKACQVMRDMNRQDRQHRVERRKARTQSKKAALSDQLSLLDSRHDNLDPEIKDAAVQVVSKSLEKLEREEERERSTVSTAATLPSMALRIATGTEIVQAAGLVHPTGERDGEVMQAESV